MLAVQEHKPINGCSIIVAVVSRNKIGWAERGVNTDEERWGGMHADKWHDRVLRRRVMHLVRQMPFGCTPRGGGTYLMEGRQVIFTRGPMRGMKLMVLSSGLLQEIGRDGKLGRLRCHRTGARD